MIIGYFGDIGSGKTTALCRQAVDLYNDGYDVYTNLDLTIPTHSLTPDDLLDIVEKGIVFPNPTVFCIDEIALYMDSRNLSKTTRILSYVILMNRKLSQGKYTFYLLYTTQYPRLIDIRLWLFTTIKGVCEFADLDDLQIVLITFHYDSIMGEDVWEDAFIANDYFKYFDTYQIIKLPKSRYDKT